MDETFLNDILECSVCLEQLDTSSKVLPCQHTFCRRCLEEIVNSHKELRCPECRVLVDTKVEDLPCNILLIRLLEGIKNNSRFTRNSNTGNDTLGRRLEVSSCGSSSNQTIPHSPHVMTPRQLRYRPGSCDGQLFPKQVVQPIPCAKALYPYEAKEPGDLSFKKGDIIVLRKRIDQNWYSGEVGGKHGFFPASYVQVLIPIPVAFPQCKALYDFRLSTECDEKDCLIFSKGEIITVIRRVDENWAEGKLGDRIGIFPISFVEMNSAARALMKLSSNLQGGPSRIAPPIPISKGAQVSGQPVTTSASSSAASMGQDSMSSNTTTPSPTSSSSSPSPGTPCSSSSTSISPPSLPQPTVSAVGLSTSQAVPAQGRMANSHQKEKRHSLSALSFSQNSPQSTASYRHSMEVLIGSTTDSTFGSDSQNKGPGPQTPVSNVLVPPTVPTQWAESTGARIIRRHSGRRERNTGNSTPQKETSETESGSSNGIPVSSSHGPSNTHVPVPIFYVAVYNYKPHKEDELELKKGELYTVCEKCQDGWFKGTSLRTGRSGVFPGNYVQLPKTSSLQPHFPQGVPPAGSMKLPASKIVSVSSPPMPVSTTTAQAMQSQSFCSSGNGSKPSGSYLNNPRSKHPESRCGILVGLREWTQSLAGIAPPPQHLPRPQPSSRNGISAVQKIKTSNGNAPKALVGAPRHTEWDVVAAPMAASYPVSSTGRTQSLPTSGSITLSWHNTNQNNGHQRSTPLVSLSAATAVTPPNVCIGVPAGESSDGASTGNTRSEKKEKKEREKVSLVKRLTSKRKSKSPPPSNYCDNPTFVDTPLTTTGATQIQAMHVRSGSCPSKALGGHQVSHKKSNSLDVNNADHAKPSLRPRQPAPLVRERFRCIVPYPPNSELELELKVGDVVYVHKKREDGWYKGTLQRTGKTGLFPGSFVESF